MKLSRFAVKHPAIITISIISLIIFSILSFMGTPISFIPDVSMPTYQVITAYPGADAKRVNDEVTVPLEKELATLSGIKSIKSTSGDSMSQITIDFTDNADASNMLPSIREKINEVMPDLPDGLSGEPYIFYMEAASVSPILSFTMESDMTDDQAALFAEETIVPALSSISGVADVKILGERKNEVRVTLDTGKMEALGLSVLNVSQILASNNLSFPAGNGIYQGKDLTLETNGEVKSVDTLADLTVGSHNGSPIFLGDIARIEMKPPVPDSLLLANGKETLLIKLFRRDGEDVLKIIGKAKKALNGIQKDNPTIKNFHIIQDESRVTINAVLSISRSLLVGILLAFGVIFLFLGNFRFALFISASLPLSILFSMIGLKLTGLSINLLSLAGLTVAIGMVVDASIVIMENIHKHLLEGMDRKTASINGATEMGSAVLASALTTISVFFPMLFLKGIIGIFFGNIAITIILSLSASLIVSLVVVPFLTAHLPGQKKDKKSRVAKALDRFSDVYKNALATMLERKGFIFAFAAAVLIISVFSLQTLGMNVFPSLDTGEIEVHLEYPPGFTLEQSRKKTEEVESLIRKEVPSLQAVLFEVTPGGATGSLVLTQATQRSRSTHEINRILTKDVNESVTDVKALFFNGGLDSLISYATGGRGYIVDLYSPDFNELELASQTVEDILKQDPAIYYVDNSIKLNNMKLQFQLDPYRMGQLGLSSYQAGATDTILYLGKKVGSFRDGDTMRDIKLISDLHGSPVSDDTMNRMHLVNSRGGTISYNSIADISLTRTAKNITRKNRLYHATITGYYFGQDVTAINKRMNGKLSEIAFPSSITRGTGGAAGMLGDELPPLIVVLLVAVFLVYAVMVIQFEKFRQPLIIMAAYPFSLIGLVFGLNVFGSVLSFIAFLGVIALAGVVVNNAIILVDYTNMLRREKGMAMREAVLESARSRLQPILMTTLTTMFGVLPMALGRGNGSEMYAPLGQVILGGMLTSTFITLFFIPALYEFIEGRKYKKK